MSQNKTIAYTKESMFVDRQKLSCSLCGEDDRNKLFIENLGIAVGMGGDEYSFCKKCSFSKDFIIKLLEMLGFGENGMKIKDDSLNFENE